ncbi:hypothetical protein QJQ45_003387 [Haematococcus lacustris]|nr:hypothetical protein QJQ45_003387 [Haematococcus lacustris]
MTVSDIPSSDTPTVLEALSGPQADYWREAMHTELASLHANGTWTLVERPPGARVLPTKWVLKIKRDATGAIDKFKARLVAKGFMQVSGVDVGDVYAPVSKHTTLRALLALAAARDMEVHQIDVEAAFLNGTLQPDEVIHIQQPEGFEEGSRNTVCRLQKALDFDSLDFVKQRLSSVFGIKDLGQTRWFLGMQISRNRAQGTLQLDQQQYIKELLSTYSMTEAHSKAVPMAPGTKLVKEGDALDTAHHSYSALVGSLLYLSCCTRPDIAYAVGALARHMAAPTQQHWTAAKAVLSYLKGTASQGLVFGGNDSLQGYCDADYAGDKDTARSTTGYVFTLHGAAISWSSRLQPTVAMSTAEAEYMAASGAVKEAVWLRKLMQDLGLPGTCVNLMCDNQAALQLLNNPMASTRSKHISVHHHFARERAARGEVMFTYCSTSEMVADVMTKPLAAVKLGSQQPTCQVSDINSQVCRASQPLWYQDPVVRCQNPVVWCQDPVVWCQDPVDPVGQDPVVWCQNPVGQDLVVWCQDPVVWCQDPVGQDPVVRCQDPVDPVSQDPVVWYQDPVSHNPVVRYQDPVEKDTHRRTLYRVLAHMVESIQTGST